MIRITPDAARIGPLWWINSDPQPVYIHTPILFGPLEPDILAETRVVRWGTCGFGLHVRIVMEPCD